MTWQFWKWLCCGLDSGRPGYRQFKLGWMLLHAGMGVGLAAAIEVPLAEASRSILLPLTGLLVGVSFSWVGNALTLLRSSEIENLSEYRPDGLSSYVYIFQLAVLVMLVTVVLWALAGLGLFDLTCSFRREEFILESSLYFFAGLSLREAWHVVMGSHELLLARSRIRRLQRDQVQVDNGTDRSK